MSSSFSSESWELTEPVHDFTKLKFASGAARDTWARDGRVSSSNEALNALDALSGMKIRLWALRFSDPVSWSTASDTLPSLNRRLANIM